MKRVEIRCCCEPTKLLGTVPVIESLVVVGRTVVLPLFGVPERGLRRSEIALEVAEWFQTVRVHGAPDEASVKRVGGGIALRGDGIAIETLRRIPGFIEAENLYG